MDFREIHRGEVTHCGFAVPRFSLRDENFFAPNAIGGSDFIGGFFNPTISNNLLVFCKILNRPVLIFYANEAFIRLRILKNLGAKVGAADNPGM